MLNRFTKLVLLLVLIVTGTTTKAQITVNDTANAYSLVSALVGTGIQFSNPVLNCATGGAGKYTVISSNLGLGDGIILTTGAAKTDTTNPTFPDPVGANGPQSLFASEDPGTPGDPELGNLVGGTTNNACILEFDFIPDGDSLLFDYVFGSEEYDQFSCSGFNDVFAFFLSGPGLPGLTNVALIPGTNIPVAINSTTNPAITLDPWQSDALCQAMGPGSPFAQYYNDNQNGTSITYYGMTTILTARAAVVPCTTYHIKLAIADLLDGALDSGVFLEANSFRSSNVKMSFKSSLSGPGASFDYLVEGCTEAEIVVSRPTAFNIPQTVEFTYTGSASRNIDYSAVPDTVVIPANATDASFSFLALGDSFTEGVEVVTVNVKNICTGDIVDSISFPIYDYLPANFLSNDTAICAGAGVRLEIEADTNFNFTWTSNTGAQIIDPATGFTWGFPDTTTTFNVKAEYKNCNTESYDVTATVEPIPVVNIHTEDTSLCIGKPLEIWADVGPDWFGNQFTYTWAPNTGLDDPFIKEPKFFVTDANTYKYILAAQTPLGCTGYDSIVIHARPAIELDVSGDIIAKYGDVIQLQASGAETYVWTPTDLLDYPTEATPKARATDTATFRVIGMNRYGCRDTAYVKMGIDYSMSEMLPNAFSPNNDGRNDVFRLRGLVYQRLQEFRIFNRWGQEIFNTTDPDLGWDGTYKGVPQDPGVYHYLIRVTTPEGIQRMYKGDVSLVR